MRIDAVETGEGLAAVEKSRYRGIASVTALAGQAGRRQRETGPYATRSVLSSGRLVAPP